MTYHAIKLAPGSAGNLSSRRRAGYVLSTEEMLFATEDVDGVEVNVVDEDTLSSLLECPGLQVRTLKAPKPKSKPKPKAKAKTTSKEESK